MSDEKTPNQFIEPFLPEIFDQEATGILTDLMGCPAISLHLMTADEDGIAKVKQYIINIFYDYYRLGLLRIAAIQKMPEQDELMAYAMLITYPRATHIACIHKIYVYEPYRGHGIGKQLLEDIVLQAGFKGLTLVCLPELVPFYKKHGFKAVGGMFIGPGEDKFSMTQFMYVGLERMVHGDVPASGFPIFMLNDVDAKAIIQLLNGAGVQ
ncbi:GNAT family N-acetyltransferase [Salmonella enterica]|nr:GNAT family N-acetyltransferase [Salmonella enterica]